MRSRIDLESKLTGEVKKYPFDFSNYMPDVLSGEAISSTTVTISVYSGVADPGAAAMLVATSVPGTTIVYVKIQNGITGNIYQILCSCNILFGGLTNTIKLAGFLAIVSEVL